MELKSPKAKKKSNIDKLISWGRMFKTPLLILFLLGTTNCERENDVNDIDSLQIQNGVHRHRHRDGIDRTIKSEINYLRRNLNKHIVNFVMTDSLVDGEVENRIHYNGITAKETSVGLNGQGLKLRQLTDGRHLIQVIYSQDGHLQDCEYITQGRYIRNFLKTLRKELKTALNEKIYSLSNKEPAKLEEEKYYRHFSNVSFRILKDGDNLPPDISSWLQYDKLKMECLQRHKELKYMLENKNKTEATTLNRSRRSFRENFILPGTKWCGAGHIAERYGDTGFEAVEDKCCRSHDYCRYNIGMFKRRFGYFNYRPYTISHCQCDRRFRACLKLADTSVSNMVGKLFFNVVQTKCFVLKPVKMCTQRSWWGKCLQKRRTKQAFLRDNLPY